MSKHSIRELSATDWFNYKAIRLMSLQDSPDSFGSTYEREVLFAAVDKESFVGLLSCVIQAPSTNRANLYQMWVRPELRGNGVGLDLVTRAKQWAYSRHVSNLSLSVTMINSDAINLYSKLGFKAVGETESLRPGSDLKCQIMEAVIDAMITRFFINYV